MISVYETETFTLIDKKSMKVESVVDFSWSPTDPIISLFVPELGGGNQPARVLSSLGCWLLNIVLFSKMNHRVYNLFFFNVF